MMNDEILRLIMDSGLLTDSRFSNELSGALNDNPNAFTPQAQRNIQTTYGVDSPMNIASGIPNTPMRPSQSIIQSSGSLIPNFITNMFNPNTYTVDGVTATQVDKIPLDPESVALGDATTSATGMNPLTLLLGLKTLGSLGKTPTQPIPPMDTRVRTGILSDSQNLFADYQGRPSERELDFMGRMI